MKALLSAILVVGSLVSANAQANNVHLFDLFAFESNEAIQLLEELRGSQFRNDFSFACQELADISVCDQAANDFSDFRMEIDWYIESRRPEGSHFSYLLSQRVEVDEDIACDVQLHLVNDDKNYSLVSYGGYTFNCGF